MTGLINAISSPIQPAIAAADTNFSSVSMLLTGDYPVSPQAYNADSSPNQRIVTPFSTVRPSCESPYQDGYFGVQFNGTTQSLSVASTTGIDISAGDFTLEFWARPNASQSNAVDSVFGYQAFGTRLYRNGSTWTCEVGNGTSNYFSLTATVSAADWQHIAFVRSGSTFSLYKDGVLASTNTTSGSLGTTSRALMIGLDVTGGTQRFGGSISNFRIVKGRAVYTANFTPPAGPLLITGDTTFMTCWSARIVDNSPTSAAITLAGSPIAQLAGIFVPPQTTGSAFFNGSSDYLSVPNPAMNTNWTVEVWVRPTVNTGGLQMILAFNNNNAEGMGIFRNAAGNLACDDGVASAVTFTNAAIPLNVWTHVALTRSGTTVTGYINGVAVGSGTFTPRTVSTLSIGRFGGTPLWFNGTISNLRVVVGSVLYSSNFTPSTTPLTSVTNTSLLTLQTGVSPVNNQFIDSSPQSRPLTPTGSPIQTGLTPYSPATWSGSFNGSTDYLQFPSNAAFEYGTGDFTVEGWFNSRNGWTGTSSLVTCDASGGCAISMSNGDLRIAPQNSPSTSLGSLSTLSSNTWYHIAVVRKSGSIRAYANGVALAAAQSYTTNFAISTCRVGGGADGVFNGLVSNVRVVKGTAVYDPVSSTISVPTFTLQAIPGTSLLTLSRSTFSDASSNNFTPTIVGTPTVTTSSPFTNSMLFGSTYFNGSSVVVAPAGSATLGSGNFTAECWVNVASTSTLQAIMGNAVSSAGGDTQWQITMLSGGTFRFQGWTTVHATSSTAIVANTWNHIAVVRNGTTLTLYLNGVSVATATNSTNISSTNGCYVGRAGDGTNALTGYVTDARVTPGVALYTSAFVPPNQPLQANRFTQFLLNSANTSLYDTAGKSLISAVGAAQARSTIRRYGPSSVFFNSTNGYLTVPNSMVGLGSGNFTIEMWIYAISRVASTPCLFGNYNTFTGQTAAIGIFAGHASANTTRFQVSLSGSFPVIQSTTTVVYGDWQHVAVVRSSGTLTLYVDGVSQGSVASSANLSGVGTNAFIGTAGDAIASSYFHGYIDDLRITPGIARYTSNFTPPAIALPKQ